ncbi:hypothetical protein FBULB1_13343 [Fusarium bulbicola]|nr:hypothetical protein FBULB1_13343 [Fusarium bulbicola]
MESQSGSPDLIESLTKLFSDSISSEWKRGRLPNRYLALYRETRASESNSTRRIFLDKGGFGAWAAYLLAKPSSAHFKGKAAREALLEELEGLPLAQRTTIAERVAASIHPTAKEHIESMETQCIEDLTTSSKRRRLNNEASTTHDDDCPISPPDATIRTINTSTDILSYTDRSHTCADSCLPEEQAQSFKAASIQGLSSVFPEYMSGAIRRNDPGEGDCVTAAITMNFPSRSIGQVGCVMTLAVESNKVEHLAMLLFKTHLESDGTSRELVLQGGTRVTPYPQLLLQGSYSDTISEVFGLEIAGAIAASPYRRQEIRVGTLATRCVTMTIYGTVHEPVLITLNLGLAEATKIYEKLRFM